jgi:UBX domain-containing protein 7
MDTTAEGRTYSERYVVHDFPHIGIIDPRTGRLLFRREGWTQENAMTAEIFAELAMDFCSRNTFDKPPQAPRPNHGGGANASSSSSSNIVAGGAGVTSRPTKRPMHEMSEAEQIEAAMRMSMEDQSITATTPTTSTTDIPGFDEGGYGVVDMTNDDVKPAASDDSQNIQSAAATAAPLIPVTPPSPTDELLSMVIPDEPTTGARVQFRLPDSKRIVRNFAPTDTVKVIYGFLAVRYKIVFILF